MNHEDTSPLSERHAPSLEEVWQEYGVRLRSYLAARASNPADVDDVLQRVLLKTHNELASIRDLRRLRGWLFRVATNALIDHERATVRLREVSAEPDADSEPVAGELLGALETDQVELADCVRVFVERLSARDREVLLAVDLEGATQRELADALGVSYSAVKSRVQRARDRLAAELSSCCSVATADDGTVLGVPRTPSCDCSK